MNLIFISMAELASYNLMNTIVCLAAESKAKANQVLLKSVPYHVRLNFLEKFG